MGGDPKPMPKWFLLGSLLLMVFFSGCGPQSPNIAGRWAGELLREDVPGLNIPLRMEFLPDGSYSLTIQGTTNPRMGKYRWVNNYTLTLDHEWNDLDYQAVVKAHRFRYPNAPLPAKTVQLQFYATMKEDLLNLASQEGEVFWNVPAGYPIRITLTRQKI